MDKEIGFKQLSQTIWP